MNIVILKLCCAAALGMLGASSVQIVKGIYTGLLLICNAIAGGVLITVSTMHMLSENAEKLEGWGLAVTSFFKPACRGGSEDCEAFPLGNALFVVGMLLIIGMERCFGHTHLDGHTSSEDFTEDSADEREDDKKLNEPVKASTLSSVGTSVAGIGAVMGVSVHSFVESVAMGSTDKVGDFTSLLFAVALHKGFTSFSVGSALKDSPSWWVGAFCYSIVSPSGIICGVLLMQLPGLFAAAAQCLAAGTLMSIGLTDLLLPTLNPEVTNRGGLHLMAACLSATAMSLLAVWI